SHSGSQQEGAPQSRQVLARTFALPASNGKRLLLQWDWDYSYGTVGLAVSGSIEARIVPQSPCVGSTLSKKLSLNNNTFVAEEFPSLDVTSFANCNVRVIFDAQNKVDEYLDNEQLYSGDFGVSNLGVAFK